MSKWQGFAATLCACAFAHLLSAQITDTVHSQRAARGASLLGAYRRPSLVFEANRGQTDPAVKYLSRAPGYTLFLTSRGPVIVSGTGCGKGYSVTRAPASATDGSGMKTPAQRSCSSGTTDWIRLHLLGMNTRTELLPREELPAKVNYFVGSDPARWHTNVPTYRKVIHHNVYSGIDLVYHLDGKTLEFDFQVAPGADPSVIRLEAESSDRQGMRLGRIRHTPSGDLIVRLGDGELRVRRPRAFQLNGGSPQPVPGDFAFAAQDTLRFRVGPYDVRRTLVIDPVLSYSTYLGGEANDGASAIAIDAAGNSYITGFTQSVAFPVLNPLANGGQLDASSQDAFVTELAAGGTSLVYSTYLAEAPWIRRLESRSTVRATRMSRASLSRPISPSRARCHRLIMCSRALRTPSPPRSVAVVLPWFTQLTSAAVRAIRLMPSSWTLLATRTSPAVRNQRIFPY
jgi:hypothetical protein